MKEFKINEFLTLKLERDETKLVALSINEDPTIQDFKTNIYVNGELFEQCKFLLLNTPIDQKDANNKIASIDEIADILGWKENGQEGVEYEIDPETEFWGHCSNLQVWSENNYDLRLLHHKIAFPLLKRLAEAGDLLANDVFKNELKNRFESKNPTSFTSLVKINISDYFTKEKIIHLIEGSFPGILTDFKKLPDNIKFEIYHCLIDGNNKSKLQEIKSSLFLKIIEKLPNHSVSDLLYLVKEIEWLKEFSATFLKNIDNLHHKARYDVFHALLSIAQQKGWTKQLIPSFLVNIDKFPIENQYFIFSTLHNIIVEKRWIKDLISSFLDSIEKLSDKDKEIAYKIYMREPLELINEYFPVFLGKVDKLPDKFKYEVFRDLIESINIDLKIKNKSEIENKYLFLLNYIDEISDELHYNAFYDLLYIAEDTGLTKKHFRKILKVIERVPIMTETQYYSDLIDKAKEKNWLDEYFSSFLELLNKIPARRKYSALYEIIDSLESTELLSKYFHQIEPKFLAMLHNIEELPDMNKKSAFSTVFQMAIKLNRIKENFLDLLEIVNDLSAEDSNFAFHTLLKKAREELWIEEHFTAFLVVIRNIPGYHKYEAFYDFYTSLRGTELLVKNHSQIETTFTTLLEGIDRLPEYDRNEAFSDLLFIAVDTELINKYFPKLLKTIEMLYYEYGEGANEAFFSLYELLD